MVQLISPRNAAHDASIEVDYSENPTVLFKSIEAKDWDTVKKRVEESPQEVSSWVTRKGKDGKIRWKILPLHAVMCMKAPDDVLLQLINAFPEACSLADDQGMLPLHLAMKNEDVDEEVLKRLLKVNPSGVNTKVKEENFPVGRPVLLALKALQEMEREKIRSEERTQIESELDEERKEKAYEIKRLQEEVSQLKDEITHGHEELEVRLTSEVEMPESDLEKYKQMEEESAKQQEKIESQTNKLEFKE